MKPVELPRGHELRSLLALPPEMPLTTAIERCIEQTIHQHLHRFLQHTGKGHRAALVEIGYRWAGETAAEATEFSEAARAACSGLSECIEAIHSGSLIIDDIQDGTRIRRGNPTMHRSIGIPLALNAGNWLYFQGLTRIAALGMSAEKELACHRLIHEVLLRAHYGQALDVGLPVDQLIQAEVYEICMAAIRLKSGVLVSLALRLGGICGGADQNRLDVLDRFGQRLGIGLQMFDDIRNLLPTPANDPVSLKRLEDLYLRRPSWVLAFASREFEARDYADLVRAMQMLPDESYLKAWLGIHGFIPRIRQSALSYLDDAWKSLCNEMSTDFATSASAKKLKEIIDRITE